MKKKSKNLKSITERNSNDKSQDYTINDVETLYFIGDIKINWNMPQNEQTIKALLNGINLLIIKLMPHNTGLTIHKIDVTKKIKEIKFHDHFTPYPEIKIKKSKKIRS